MHRIEYSILALFKKEPNREFSTSEILSQVLPREYNILKDEGNDASSKEKQHTKAKLHRKLLYHLNKLVREEVLTISSIGEHGEKKFRLAFDTGDYIIEKKQRKILISKPRMPLIPVQKFEEIGLVKKFDPESWMTRLNAVILNSSEIESLGDLYEITTKLFSYVNDLITIPNFEEFVNKFDEAEVTNFINKINIDTQDYNRAICLTININAVKEDAKLIEFYKYLRKLNPDLINVVWKMNNRILQTEKKLFEEILNLCMLDRGKVNIQNISMNATPLMIGKAGVYTFIKEEWEEFLKSDSKTSALAVSQMTLIVDLGEYKDKLKSSKEFRSMINKLLRGLLLANSTQRKYALSYFRDPRILKTAHPFEFFKLSRHCIRFWNYDMQNDENIVNLINSCKSEVEEFCKTEDIIYKSCGIPIRFRAGFSSKFTKFEPENYSDRKYVKKTIRSIEDFSLPDVKKEISDRERFNLVFDGCDRVRFFRSGSFTSKDVLKEFQYLMSSTTLPLFCYDFAQRRETVKLTEFI